MGMLSVYWGDLRLLGQGMAATSHILFQGGFGNRQIMYAYFCGTRTRTVGYHKHLPRELAGVPVI